MTTPTQDISDWRWIPHREGDQLVYVSRAFSDPNFKPNLMQLRRLREIAESKRTCSQMDTCLNDPDCACYCAVKCGPRKKTPADNPIYFPPHLDPFGKGCYCAPRDLNILALQPTKCQDQEKQIMWIGLPDKRIAPWKFRGDFIV